MTKIQVVDPRLAWFVSQMRSKLSLSKNQSKDDWRGLKLFQLMSHLEREVDELGSEYFNLLQDTAEDVKEKKGRAIRECADVANLAMMIADHIKHSRRFK